MKMHSETVNHFIKTGADFSIIFIFSIDFLIDRILGLNLQSLTVTALYYVTVV